MQTNNLSYVHGSCALPLIGDTLGVFFDKIVARFGEREALVVRHQHVRWTYRELQRRVNNLAASLIRLGPSCGRRAIQRRRDSRAVARSRTTRCRAMSCS